MSDIEKIDAAGGLAAFAYAPEHPAVALWMAPENGLLRRIKHWIAQRQLHPARTVVVLPYAQLRPLATRLWSRTFGAGFAPRFETTVSWCRSLAATPPGPLDLRYDTALDLLTAQDFLERAGLGEHQTTLAPLLVQSAQQLGALAAAQPPERRSQWAAHAREAVADGMGASVLGWEAAVARIAVEWAAASANLTDPLYAPALRHSVDALVFVLGLQPDPMAGGLSNFWGEAMVCLPLAADQAQLGMSATSQPEPESATGPEPKLRPGTGAAPETELAKCVPHLQLHACTDAEDEASHCAARAITLINEGHFPLALVSSDRVLTRRVRAMLETAGVQMRDENGWKLSTSNAAAAVMALLRSLTWNVSTDAVLNWLKAAPGMALPTDALEVALRRDQVRDWRDAAHAPRIQKNPELMAALETIEAVRMSFKGRHRLAQWLGLLDKALTRCDLRETLAADAAGLKVLEALRLEPVAHDDEGLLNDAVWAQRALTLADFSQWVNQVLESASFQPPYPVQEEVVILPMSQMLGRPFAAVLLAGCDEARLNPSVEPPGVWTPGQRRQLGLPSREALTAATQSAWMFALQTPRCHVFWRTSDETGETLMPSALVQMLPQYRAAKPLPSGAMAHATDTTDARVAQVLPTHPVHPPSPVAPDLNLRQLTQGAYEDLRHCPYRYFALRQLGLQSVDELEGEVDKRDFGLWLHDVLKRFHEALVQQPDASRPQRLDIMSAAVEDATRASGLPESEFLPFSAAWPAVRERYLNWLEVHEKTGARFVSAETSHTQGLGPWKLFGRIDRTDRTTDGDTLVLDYKTESPTKTAARVKQPLEDTQMAFYAALLDTEAIRGMYLAISERDPVKAVEQVHIAEARDALLEGIQTDMQRIEAGAALHALGEGSSCDYCNARGLCRKDFWEAP